MTPHHHVVGIGNAIVDVIAQAGDDFIEANNLLRGAMRLISEEEAETLYGQMGPGREVSGGSAANTITGIATLGGRVGYIGKVSNDQLGEVFRHDIRAAGVTFDTPPIQGLPSTARCLILVTPDAQRTMNTYLGACVELGPDDVDADLIESAQVTYLEGYLWDKPTAKEAFLRAAEIAHRASRRVSLTLSDTFCVERHLESFRTLVADHVDVLFGNEDEIKTLCGVDDIEDALAHLNGECELIVTTRGEQGSTVLAGPMRFDVPAEPIERLVDTTGAGDLYAAGFLHGFTQGRHPAECARMGGIAAAEILSTFGARPKADLPKVVAARLAAPAG